LSPEVKNAKGGIMSTVTLPPKNELIMDIHVAIGNEDFTSKGGAGMAFYFLESVNQNEIGESKSLFGYSKQFNGF
jgi:hypothetical protein